MAKPSQDRFSVSTLFRDQSHLSRLLDSGLDPDDVKTFWALDDKARQNRGLVVAGSFRFQKSEDGPIDTAEIAIGPYSPTFSVTVAVTTNSKRLAETLEHAFSDDATAGMRAEEEADFLTLKETLEAAGAGVPSHVERGQRRIDQPAAKALMSAFEKAKSSRARRWVLLHLQAPKTKKAVKNVVGAWLLDQFIRFENRQIRDEFVAALESLTLPEHFDRIVAIVENRNHGSGRTLLCGALGMTGKPEAGHVLAKLLETEWPHRALRGFQKLGRPGATHAPAARALLAHPQKEIQRLAARVLRIMGVDTEPIAGSSTLEKD